MGKQIEEVSHPFTLEDVKNRDLVIEMLKYEEELARSEQGQNMYKNKYMEPQTSITVEKTLNRMTLAHFGFDTTDGSVANYRSIFNTYFNSPDDYDKEVINSSYYMRENKFVFYKSPDLTVDAAVPNVPLYELDGTTELDMYTAINREGSKLTVVGAFSLS